MLSASHLCKEQISHTLRDNTLNKKNHKNSATLGSINDTDTHAGGPVAFMGGMGDFHQKIECPRPSSVARTVSRLAQRPPLCFPRPQEFTANQVYYSL